VRRVTLRDFFREWAADDPLERHPALTYVPAMVDRTGESPERDTDVEIFERIPWESLEKNPDRRWIAYLLSGALVLGAVGVSLGRQLSAGSALPPDPAPIVTTTLAVLPSTLATVGPTTVPETTAADRVAPGARTEADLMALSDVPLEMAAATAAEWFVVDYFTRDDPGEGRSFVEWAGSLETTWIDPTTIEVTVAVRRLAAAPGIDYRRMGPEAWRVTVELGDEGWSVVEGPVEAGPVELSVTIPEIDAPVPAEVAATLDGEEVVGAVEVGGRWLAEVEWVDAAGLSWWVRRWVDGAS
jgi:hypothetical protein